MGYRVAVCGIDGAGKSVLIDNLYSYFSSIGISTLKAKVNFPCKHICKKAGLHDDALIKRVGMAYDFVEYYQSIDFSGQLILCDRYDLCYRVLNQVDLTDEILIKKLDLIYDIIPSAELYIYLNLPVDIAISRLEQRGNRETDESECILEKMQYCYEKEIKKKPCYVIIDANKPTDVIFQIAKKEINCIMGCCND